MPDLHDAAFIAGAVKLRDLPPDTDYEVAFTGRSNAGKSSALNALTGRAGLARVSKTPGRTQQLNVFALDAGHRLIDLPGYGYAKVPQALRQTFLTLVYDYLSERRSLQALVLLADIRHGLKAEDRALLAARVDLPILVLLSKADKVNRGERAKQVREAAKAAPENAFFLPFSAHNNEGVEEARAMILGFLKLSA
ncbi:MAG TPA: ribosome biogenesis GTP-binding protein YihA/YsxC [Acidiferrobacter sp.]|nr:ribosome biogenesis GTP-binding protein YihA/YsxC [Acidiferrobacter sp.]